MTLACEQLFGQQRGMELQAHVQRVTGETCPCLQGERCPLECDRKANASLAESLTLIAQGGC